MVLWRSRPFVESPLPEPFFGEAHHDPTVDPQREHRPARAGRVRPIWLATDLQAVDSRMMEVIQPVKSETRSQPSLRSFSRHRRRMLNLLGVEDRVFWDISS